MPDDVPAALRTRSLPAHQFCHYSGDQFHVLVTDHAEGVSYSVKPMCVETQDVADACVNQQTCEEPPNTWKFMVFRSQPGSPNVPWGTVCLDTDTANEFDVITPGKVFKEMQKLAWPEAEMVIQPPDGRTLVNLETNFLTTTTEPTTQTDPAARARRGDRGDAGRATCGTSATARARRGRTRERSTPICGSPTSTSRPGSR